MKLKLLMLSCFLAVNCYGQFVATNRVQNTVTWYSTNSPVFAGFYFEAGVDMATNANPQAFTHSIWNYNPANSVFSLRNTAPSGLARITIKEHGGVDSGLIGSDSGGSNIVIHSFIGANGFIKLTGFMGGGGNEFILNSGVSTNTGGLVVGGNLTVLGTMNTINGGVGRTFSSTNVSSPGVSNVLVFTNGVFVNTFTIP